MNIRIASTAQSEPGIYAGIPNPVYHAGPGISKSQLDVLARSPAHFFDTYLSASPARRIETDAMAIGTAIHTAILEPADWAKWVVTEKFDRRTNAGKAAAAEAEERAAALGVPMIDRDTAATVNAIAASFYRHPVAQFMEDGFAELSVYWIDEDTGCLCRCRPDWLFGEGIVDLKSTDDASPRGFMGSAYKWRYFVQSAFYLDGLAANGINVSQFIFAAIEKNRPHIVVAYRATEELIEAGRREYRRLLRLYSSCVTAGQWPGYLEFADLELPPWAPERVFADFDNAEVSNTERT